MSPFRIHHRQHLFPRHVTSQILAHQQPAILLVDVRIGRDVGRDDDVWHLSERVTRGERLGISHVEPCTGDDIVLQRLHEV